MKFSKFIVAALSICALSLSVGCGKSAEEDEKDAESMVQEFDSNRKAIIRYSGELNTIGVDVFSYSAVSDDTWKNLSPEDRKIVKKKLSAIKRSAHRNLEIDDHKSVYIKGDREAQRRLYILVRDSAGSKLNALKQWETENSI